VAAIEPFRDENQEDTNTVSHWVQDTVTRCRGKQHLTPPPTSADIFFTR
jgi:hypothetical protein